METIEDLVESIRFVILSECDDQKMLKTLYELVGVKAKQEKIKSSKHIYYLHLYTHYLQIKKYKIKLPTTLNQ